MGFKVALQGQEVETTIFRVPVVAVEPQNRCGQRAANHIAARPGRVGRCDKSRHLGLNRLMAGLHLGCTFLGLLSISTAVLPALSVQMQQNRGEIIAGGRWGRRRVR